MKKIIFVLLIGLFSFSGQAIASDSCGTSGKRVCYVWEKYPLGCEPNLVAHSGVCKHPNCGRDRQAACKPSARLLPCDWGLVLNPANGICYTTKEVKEKAEELAAVSTCKSIASLFRVGDIPPMMKPVADEMAKQAKSAQSSMAKYETTVRSFVQKNAGNYNEVLRVADMLKKDHNKAAALKKYLSADNVCANKPFNTRVAELRNLGVIPTIQKLAQRPDRTLSFSLISSAIASEKWDPVLVVWDKVALNAVVKGVGKFGFLIDFRTGQFLPIAGLGIGGATNIKAEIGVEMAFMYEPHHDVATGMDLVIEVSGGEGVGGGVGVVWNPNLPYPYGGSGNVVAEASVVPVDLGVTAEWHWVLAPKYMGGAL